ncbi:MAG: hypothetical protein IJU96_00080 [Clostridia bacterium]|nr:hypothetical protein [Clostridia bacterium]
MKKQGLCIVLATAMLSTVLASCSLGGESPTDPQPTQHPVMSYSEKVSYYDALVAGDNDPIPLTTALNKSVSIEGDPELLNEEVYERILEIANETFPRVRSKYGTSGSQAVVITLETSPADITSCYAVGSTVVLNVDWFNKHPNDCDALIEGIAMAVMQHSESDKKPAWLINALKVYIRDEFALYKADSSLSLPKRYNGKSYESNSSSAAAFLKWVRDTQHVDIAERLNRQLRTIDGYQDIIWREATGKTLNQLWDEYKNA